jgi:hypothetical protein
MQNMDLLGRVRANVDLTFDLTLGELMRRVTEVKSLAQ